MVVVCMMMKQPVGTQSFIKRTLFGGIQGFQQPGDWLPYVMLPDMSRHNDIVLCIILVYILPDTTTSTSVQLTVFYMLAAVDALSNVT